MPQVTPAPMQGHPASPPRKDRSKASKRGICTVMSRAWRPAKHEPISLRALRTEDDHRVGPRRCRHQLSVQWHPQQRREGSRSAAFWAAGASEGARPSGRAAWGSRVGPSWRVLRTGSQCCCLNQSWRLAHRSDTCPRRAHRWGAALSVPPRPREAGSMMPRTVKRTLPPSHLEHGSTTTPSSWALEPRTDMVLRAVASLSRASS